ncbi:hypothetical protein C8R45DRAFT_1000243 [Mycena sanguinolenta]|nr:hypothetical protein C8R45DRAFT_1000243 [Mycena sanguinolenta]
MYILLQSTGPQLPGHLYSIGIHVPHFLHFLASRGYQRAEGCLHNLTNIPATHGAALRLPFGCSTIRTACPQHSARSRPRRRGTQPLCEPEPVAVQLSKSQITHRQGQHCRSTDAPIYIYDDTSPSRHDGCAFWRCNPSPSGHTPFPHTAPLARAAVVAAALSNCCAIARHSETCHPCAHTAHTQPVLIGCVPRRKRLPRIRPSTHGRHDAPHHFTLGSLRGCGSKLSIDVAVLQC